MTDSKKNLFFILDDYPADDAATAIDALSDDVNLQYRARRYRMIGEAMRNELPAAIDSDFHHAVMAKIAAEEQRQPAATKHQADTEETDSGWFGLKWLKPLSGLTIAAAVAVITISVWQPLGQDPAGGAELASAEQQKIEQLSGQPQVDAVPASTSLRPLGTRWNMDQDMPGLEKKLNAYLVNHTEYSNSVQGLIPQARVAGFDAQR